MSESSRDDNRTLDLRVARALGCDAQSNPGGEPDLVCRCTDDCEVGGLDLAIPEFSADPLEMMGLFDAVQVLGWYVEIYLHPDSDCLVRIMESGTARESLGEAEGDSMPRAVCQAFIAATKAV